jgi:ABC-2 type transport system permease protein
MGAVSTIAWLELRRMVRGKKLLILLLVLVAAAVLGFVVRRYAPDPGGEEGGWPAVYVILMVFLFQQTLVLLVPLLFMTGLLRDDVEDGTLVYLFTRPVPKPLAFAAKFAAAAALSSALLAGGMLLFHAAFTLSARSPVPDFAWGRRLGAFVAAGILGAVGYGALFALAGLVSRRAHIFGIVYGFLSEFVLSFVPAVIKKLTLMHYLRSVALGGLMDDASPESRAMVEALREARLFDLTAPGTAVLTVFAAAAVFLLASLVLVSVLEFPLQRAQESS